MGNNNNNYGIKSLVSTNKDPIKIITIIKTWNETHGWIWDKII